MAATPLIPIRTRTPRSILVLCVLLACIDVGSACPAPARTIARPRNVVFMIPDGCGPASIRLARLLAGRPLALDSILVGACETASASSRLTDSAAGATAYASGVRTRNRALGMDAAARPVATLMELARAHGMATGAVVKSTVTDATPAAFFAHVQERSSESDIAQQELAHRPEVLLGGGRDFFLPKAHGGARADSIDLLARARTEGYAVVSTRAAFERTARLPLLGLFAGGNLHYRIDQDATAEPLLPAMTERALALLGAGRRPFVLMVEGSLVDVAAHENDPATHAREVLDYDAAVRAAVRFARRDGHTLVISVADHECGGLGLGLRYADSSAHDVEPGALAPVRWSAVRMADSIQAGAAMERVLAGAGLGDVTDEERAAVVAAGPAHRVADAIAGVESRRAHIGWTTGWHTAVDVGLYAFGPGAERFRGLHANDAVGRIAADLLGFTLPRPLAAPAATHRAARP